MNVEPNDLPQRDEILTLKEGGVLFEARRIFNLDFVGQTEGEGGEAMKIGLDPARLGGFRIERKLGGGAFSAGPV